MKAIPLVCTAWLLNACSTLAHENPNTFNVSVQAWINNVKSCAANAINPLESMICSLESKNDVQQFLYIREIVDWILDQQKYSSLYKFYDEDEMESVKTELIIMYQDWVNNWLTKIGYSILQLDINTLLNNYIRWGRKRERNKWRQHDWRKWRRVVV